MRRLFERPPSYSSVYHPPTYTSTRPYLSSLVFFFLKGISGANINPAVTLALAITRKMSLFRAVCYVLAQLLGATIGAAMARHVSPEIFDRCVRLSELLYCVMEWMRVDDGVPSSCLAPVC